MNYKPTKYDFATFKKLLLCDKKSQQEYEQLEEEFALITELVQARKRAQKSQQDVAKLMHTTSSAISRLESVAGQQQHSPTLATLKKYALAVNCNLLIKLVPISHRGE